MIANQTTPPERPKLSLAKSGMFTVFFLIIATLFHLYHEAQLHRPPLMKPLEQIELMTFKNQLTRANDIQQDIFSKISDLGTADQLHQVLTIQQALLDKLQSMAQGEALQQDLFKKVDDLSARLEEIKSLTQLNAEALASSAAISTSIEKSVRLAIDRPISLNELAKSTPNCPISAGMDACVHHGTNIAHLVELCGPITVLVGDCRDRVYRLTVTTKEFLAEVCDYTTIIVVQGIDIGRELDSFVQKRSRWIIDTMGGNGYELLTSFVDKERLALQEDLDRLQHRCTNFFNGAKSFEGFGSHWHTVGLALAFSQYYNMTLYPTSEYANFIPLTSYLSKYMEHAERYRVKTGVSIVYLMTDDDQVIKSTQDYSNFQFHYANVARSNKGWSADRDAGSTMEKQEQNFLVD
ncbi:hypothetical protein BGZ92_005445, partial [Podila epicladia]